MYVNISICSNFSLTLEITVAMDIIHYEFMNNKGTVYEPCTLMNQTRIIFIFISFAFAFIGLCDGRTAIFFTENQPDSVFNYLKSRYNYDLTEFSSNEDFQMGSKEGINVFFHSDDKIVPTVVAPGKLVNIYFYKNNNKLAPSSLDNIENLSSYDLILTETFEDLKQFITQANSILIKLASESKYVPLIRILRGLDSISEHVQRTKSELPFKEYVVEALPIFKTKKINIEPREGSNNVAVIVESAIHPTLELVVRNVMYYLQRGWSLIIYHSEENEIFIKNALKDLSNIEYRLPPSPIYLVKEYNLFMKTYEFYKSLNAKKF